MNIITFQKQLIITTDQEVYRIKPQFKKQSLPDNKKSNESNNKKKPKKINAFYKYEFKKLSKRSKDIIVVAIKMKKNNQDYLLSAGHNLSMLHGKKWRPALNPVCINSVPLGKICDLKNINETAWMLTERGLFSYNIETGKFHYDLLYNADFINYKKPRLQVLNDTLYILSDSAGVFKVIPNNKDTNRTFYVYLLHNSFITKKGEESDRWKEIITKCIKDWYDRIDTNNFVLTFPKGIKYHLPNDTLLLRYPFKDDSVQANKFPNLNSAFLGVIDTVKTIWNDFSSFRIMIILDITKDFQLKNSTIKKIKLWKDDCHCNFLIDPVCITLDSTVELGAKFNDCNINDKYKSKLKDAGLMFVDEDDQNIKSQKKTKKCFLRSLFSLKAKHEKLID